MKVFYWNARGIANDDKQRALANLIRAHRPLIVCISKPFVLVDSFPFGYWRSLGLRLVATNNRGLQDPNLWVFFS